MTTSFIEKLTRSCDFRLNFIMNMIIVTLKKYVLFDFNFPVFHSLLYKEKNMNPKYRTIYRIMYLLKLCTYKN